MFRAAPQHVDGAGSSISFDFIPYWPQNNPSFVRARLTVSAYIVNPDPVGLGRPIYEFAAFNNWSVFANRLDGVGAG